MPSNINARILLLNTVTCDLSTQLLHRPITVDTVSQEYPLTEGQFITYKCPPRFVLIGPNASVCTGNGEWVPDPGEVDCLGDNLYYKLFQCIASNFTDSSVILLNSEHDY